MNREIKADELVIHQLKNCFCLGEDDEDVLLSDNRRMMKEAEERACKAIEGIGSKYYSGTIDPYNGVMYVNYLYWLSRICNEEKKVRIADMVYSLNRMLHAVELFYEVKLPEIWSCEHPIGSVMGKAHYGNRFFFYQGCTVGGNRRKGVLSYPVLGENVLMYSNSKILGDSRVGDNVIVAANTYIINQEIPSNVIVFGKSPDLVFKTY